MVAQLMDVANDWANGEDYMRNDRPRGHDDRDYQQDSGQNRGYDPRKKRKFPNFDPNELAEMVAAGFHNDREGNRRKREWRQRQPEQDGEQMLTGPCPFHPYKDEHGNISSGHQLKDCRKFEKLLAAYRRIHQAAQNKGYSAIPGMMAQGAPEALPLPPPQLADRKSVV